MHIGIIKDAFTPGNVIYSGYWNKYDLVLQLVESGTGPNQHWQVVVVGCFEDGTPIPGEEVRGHMTIPDISRDVIVSRGNYLFVELYQEHLQAGRPVSDWNKSTSEPFSEDLNQKVGIPAYEG